MRRSDWEAAAKLWKRVLDRDPSLADIWVQYGHALKEQGEYGKAEAAYREALRLEPGSADAHLQFGHLLKMTDRWEEAAEAYLISSEIAPDIIDATLELKALRARGASPAAVRPVGGAPAPRASRDVGNHSSGARAPHAAGPFAALYGHLSASIGTAAAVTGWVTDVSPFSISGFLPRARVEGGAELALTVNDDAPVQIKMSAVVHEDKSLGRSEIVPFHFPISKFLGNRGDTNKVAISLDGESIPPYPMYVYSERLHRQISHTDAATLHLFEILQNSLFR